MTDATAVARTRPSPAHALPFELRMGHVLLAASVNGRPATLVLDSGASACVLDGDWAAELALPPFGSPTAAIGASGALSVTLATAQSIRVGALELRDEVVALLPLMPVSEQHGRLIAGAIGYALFKRFVVEIDYAESVLRLYEPLGYEYSGSGTVLPIDVSQRLPIAAVTITPHGGAPIPARLVLDIAASSLCVGFTAPFALANEAAFATGPSIEMAQTTGVGGLGSGRLTRLAGIDLAGLEVRGPTAALMRDKAGFFAVTWADGVLGAPVFSRTRMILDYNGSRVIFEPTAGFDAPYPADASGVSLAARAPLFDSVFVKSVQAGSVAEVAGIAAGDTIVSVEGEPSTGATLEAVRDELKTGDVIRRVLFRRGGRDIEVRLELRTPF